MTWVFLAVALVSLLVWWLGTDLAPVAANVAPGTGMSTTTGSAGEAITAGQPVFKASVTGGGITANKVYQSDANVAARQHADGISLNAAAINQPVSYGATGELTVGATLVAGMAYIVSGNQGMIAPITDGVAGWKIIQLFIAKSTTVATMNIKDSGASL